MKLIFDREEVTAKLAAALESEGIVITDQGSVQWRDDGSVVLDAKVGKPASPYDESTQRLDAMEDAILNIQAGLQKLIQAQALVLAEPVKKVHDIKDKNDPQPKPKPEITGLTERMKQVQAEIEAEGDLVVSPFGGTPVKNRRRRSSNEYDSFPTE